MVESLKVLSTFPFSSAALESFRQIDDTEVVCISDTDEFLVRLKEAEVLCSYWLPNTWREQAPRLRWLQCSEAGIDTLRPTGILDEESGVVVTTAAGVNATAIGEYVFCSMLMFNRKWPEMVRLQQNKVWPRSPKWYGLEGRELIGQRLGIVGLGSIGRRVAQLGRAFGMRVLATRSASLPDGERDPDVDRLYPASGLHEMLSQSDYVVLAVPLTPQTEYLIGEAELQAMQPHTYLVNVARGRVIDEKMLIRALQEGWIAGAGLDVVEEEPLPVESPLYTLPNVILTPHMAGVSTHYNERLAEIFADNLQRYQQGRPLRNLYQPERKY